MPRAVKGRSCARVIIDSLPFSGAFWRKIPCRTHLSSPKPFFKNFRFNSKDQRYLFQREKKILAKIWTIGFSMRIHGIFLLSVSLTSAVRESSNSYPDCLKVRFNFWSLHTGILNNNTISNCWLFLNFVYYLEP